MASGALRATMHEYLIGTWWPMCPRNESQAKRILRNVQVESDADDPIFVVALVPVRADAVRAVYGITVPAER
jgi:hypothetical protein